jgi:hypothetical protein
VQAEDVQQVRVCVARLAGKRHGGERVLPEGLQVHDRFAHQRRYRRGRFNRRDIAPAMRVAGDQHAVRLRSDSDGGQRTAA